MRHVLAPTGEDPAGREGEWIIGTTDIVIDFVFAEKRLTNDTAEKAWEVPCFKTETFKASKIL